MDIPKRKRKQP